MISNISISDPTSKIIALQNFAGILERNTDCKKAHLLALQEIRKAEMKLETAKIHMDEKDLPF